MGAGQQHQRLDAAPLGHQLLGPLLLRPLPLLTGRRNDVLPVPLQPLLPRVRARRRRRRVPLLQAPPLEPRAAPGRDEPQRALAGRPAAEAPPRDGARGGAGGVDVARGGGRRGAAGQKVSGGEILRGRDSREGAARGRRGAGVGQPAQAAAEAVVAQAQQRGGLGRGGGRGGGGCCRVDHVARRTQRRARWRPAAAAAARLCRGCHVLVLYSVNRSRCVVLGDGPSKRRVLL